MTEMSPVDVRRQSSIRGGKIAGKLGLPPRPGSPQPAGNLAWTRDARCATPEAPAMTELTTQAEADEVIEQWCARCPVARACITEGRRGHGWGLWGGYVLAAGNLAPDARGDAAFRDPSVWPVLEPLDEAG